MVVVYGISTKLRKWSEGAKENETEQLAIYRYSEEYLGYEYLGGIVDTLNKNVSVDITLPGQYVLAVDNAEPLITSFKVSDASKTPTITIGLDEFSGFNEFSMKIDGIDFITSENWKNYYDKNRRMLIYPIETELEEGVHRVSIYAIDSVGNAMISPIEYEFMVDSIAPKIKDVKVSLDENQMRIRVRSDDTDIESVSVTVIQTLEDETKIENEFLLEGTEGYYTELVDIDKEMVSVEVIVTVKDSYGNIAKSAPIIKAIEEREENVENDLWIRFMDGSGLNGQAYSYTGKAIKPVVRVYDGTTLLKEKVDYTISYKNNTKANDGSNSKTAPTITIIGKGNYSGKVTKTFAIQPKSLEHEDIIAADLVVKANSKVQKPLPTVKDGTKTLKNKTNYTLEYPDLSEENPDAYKAAGEYRIWVHGKGNYSGTLKKNFSIKAYDIGADSAEKMTVHLTEKVFYQKGGSKPKPLVMYGNQVLKEGTIP